MNDNATSTKRNIDKVEISISIDAEVLEQLKHLTNDPSRIIETAIKQWLNGERDRDDDLTRRFRRNPPLPPRGEWND
ncbi:type II toxin-antitoxin system CcdA family antitoxin [Crocosphaera sp. Alani8]|uniref:type II toxin-antitoxin system CcdA family antitoxin n=1 Tax=Crocosphaera sp. Alani8 TaxID=3038952 RepID=UPI00313D8566